MLRKITRQLVSAFLTVEVYLLTKKKIVNIWLLCLINLFLHIAWQEMKGSPDLSIDKSLLDAVQSDL